MCKNKIKNKSFKLSTLFSFIIMFYTFKTKTTRWKQHFISVILQRYFLGYNMESDELGVSVGLGIFHTQITCVTESYFIKVTDIQTIFIMTIYKK